MSEFSTGRYHDGEGWRCALVREGRTKLHLVYITDAGVTHDAVDRTELRHISPLSFRGTPYPVERAVRRFRAAARGRGITESAKAELVRAETVT